MFGFSDSQHIRSVPARCSFRKVCFVWGFLGRSQSTGWLLSRRWVLPNSSGGSSGGICSEGGGTECDLSFSLTQDVIFVTPTCPTQKNKKELKKNPRKYSLTAIFGYFLPFNQRQIGSSNPEMTRDDYYTKCLLENVVINIGTEEMDLV